MRGNREENKQSGRTRLRSCHRSRFGWLRVGALLPGLRVAIAVNAAIALVAALMVGLFLRLPSNDSTSR